MTDDPKGTVAWIIEPKTADRSPYLTLKPEVAEKRRKAGDHVTPYVSKAINSESEEL